MNGLPRGWCGGRRQWWTLPRQGLRVTGSYTTPEDSNLTESRLNRLDAADKPTPISSRLNDHFSAQISTLSSNAQRFLLVAAADISGDRSLIRAAALTLGCGPESEGEATERHFILGGPRVTFRHPLVRSAAYAGASQERRREVHRIFANLVAKSAHPDRWARHVVLGANGPDAQLASELEETAQLARARGGYAAEAVLLVQAAELSERLEDRAARLLRAADARLHAGDYQEVAILLDEAQPYLSDPLAVAEAARLRASLCIQTYQTAAAPGMMLAASRLLVPLDVGRARQALLEAFGAYGIALQFTSGIEAADISRLVDMTTQVGVTASLEDDVLEGTSQLIANGPEAGYPRLRMAAARFSEGAVSYDEIARLSSVGGVIVNVLNELLDDRAYRAWVEQTDRSARENGALFVLLFNLFALVESEVRVGDLAGARARHEEALDVAAAIGLPGEFYAPMSADIHAWAGDDEQAMRCAALLIELNSAAGIAVPMIMGYKALAVLHLGAGRYKEALEATAYVHEQDPLGWTSQSLPIAIEAAARSNQVDLAKLLLTRLDVRACASGTDWAVGLRDQSRALVSAGARAERSYKSALAHLGQTTVTRDLAYARLLYGEWLRRENRRIDAREQLRAAYEYFAAMGARGFAGRAEAELLATGERTPPRRADNLPYLTPQERRVATLAAERLTNPEIAAKLFLSPATVDYHLRKVYRKLHITSRRELAKSLGAMSVDPSRAQAASS